MNNMMDGVNQRTNLAGTNRLELLLFRLGGSQLYGINVFKVREAIPCPELTKMPNANPVVCGIASIRGQTVSVVDLSLSIGRRAFREAVGNFVILTEYNRSVQGFLVSKVDRIINISWSDVLPPPAATGAQNYMTAITKVDDQIVQILDVEQVLAKVIGTDTSVSATIAETAHQQNREQKKHILTVDDSSVARNQIKRTLDQIGIESTLAKNGREALSLLQGWAQEGQDITEHVALMISDIEMPEMDGYTLTAEVRKDASLKPLQVLLHTSMSGTFNEALVQKVGADCFLPKFSPDELAAEVQRLIS
jgi:two-component system chemotaxis response regulator CheV